MEVVRSTVQSRSRTGNFRVQSTINIVCLPCSRDLDMFHDDIMIDDQRQPLLIPSENPL
jgi:hypothetical protein